MIELSRGTIINFFNSLRIYLILIHTFFLTFFQEQSGAPHNVRVTNKTPTTLTIAWEVSTLLFSLVFFYLRNDSWSLVIHYNLLWSSKEIADISLVWLSPFLWFFTFRKPAHPTEYSWSKSIVSLLNCAFFFKWF